MFLFIIYSYHRNHSSTFRLVKVQQLRPVAVQLQRLDPLALCRGHRLRRRRQAADGHQRAREVRHGRNGNATQAPGFGDFRDGKQRISLDLWWFYLVFMWFLCGKHGMFWGFLGRFHEFDVLKSWDCNSWELDIFWIFKCDGQIGDCRNGMSAKQLKLAMLAISRRSSCSTHISSYFFKLGWK